MALEQSEILKRLQDLEASYAVKIIYACESGSRAWGFPSTDSDFDVRFIYARPLSWYLSVAERRDVIEPAIDEVFDFGGWDLRKSLHLLRKSNCPLIEWLSSPIVYRQNEIAIEPINKLVLPAFKPNGSCRHYLAMANNRLNAIQQNESAHLKAYFYALRALLCARFIVDHKTPPPMAFGGLLQEYLVDGPLRQLIDQLLVAKTSGREKSDSKRYSEIEFYLTENLSQLDAMIPKNPDNLELEVFDQAFREILAKLWVADSWLNTSENK